MRGRSYGVQGFKSTVQTKGVGILPRGGKDGEDPGDHRPRMAVLKIAPYKDDQPEETLKLLRNSVIKYDRPTEPVDVEEWEALT